MLALPVLLAPRRWECNLAISSWALTTAVWGIFDLISEVLYRTIWLHTITVSVEAPS